MQEGERKKRKCVARKKTSEGGKVKRFPPPLNSFLLPPALFSRPPTHHVLPLREVHLEQVAVGAVQRPERVVPEPELGVDPEEAQGQDEAGLQGEGPAAEAEAAAAAAAAAAGEEASSPSPSPSVALLLPPFPPPAALLLARRRARAQEHGVPRAGGEGPLRRRGRVRADDAEEPPEPEGQEGDPREDVPAIAPVRRLRDRGRVEQRPGRQPHRLRALLHDLLEARRDRRRRPDGGGDGLGRNGLVVLGRVHFFFRPSPCGDEDSCWGGTQPRIKNEEKEERRRARKRRCLFSPPSLIDSNGRRFF